MENKDTKPQENKLEWQTPELEIIASEKTELSPGVGFVDGLTTGGPS